MLHCGELSTEKKDLASGGASLDTAMYMSWLGWWFRVQCHHRALWSPSMLPSEESPSALPACSNKAMLLKTKTIAGIIYHKGHTLSMSHFSYVAYKIPVLSWVFQTDLCVSESSFQITSAFSSSRNNRFRELPDGETLHSLAHKHSWSLASTCPVPGARCDKTPLVTLLWGWHHIQTDE